MTYSWRFNTRRPSEKRREPIQGEYFAAEAISNPGEALVREGIQNSLDARRNDGKVMVRIRVSGTGAWQGRVKKAGWGPCSVRRLGTSAPCRLMTYGACCPMSSHTSKNV